MGDCARKSSFALNFPNRIKAVLQVVRTKEPKRKTMESSGLSRRNRTKRNSSGSEMTHTTFFHFSHGFSSLSIEVAIAHEMEDPMDDIEERLVVRIEAPFGRISQGGRRTDDNFA